jgi:hypothetical protein
MHTVMHVYMRPYQPHARFVGRGRGAQPRMKRHSPAKTRTATKRRSPARTATKRRSPPKSWFPGFWGSPTKVTPSGMSASEKAAKKAARATTRKRSPTKASDTHQELEYGGQFSHTLMRKGKLRVGGSRRRRRR